MQYFNYGGSLRLADNPNYPNRICDSYVAGRMDGEQKIALVADGKVSEYPLYDQDQLPVNIHLKRLVPLLDPKIGAAMFNHACAAAAVKRQRVGQVLFDMCIAHNLVVNLNNAWYLSDLVTLVDDFYYEDDLSTVQNKFFKQFVSN